MTSTATDLVNAPPDAGFAAAVRDLADVRRTAAAAGLAQPGHLVVDDEAAAFAALDAFGVLALRRRTEPGTRDVTVCRDRAALRAWLRGRFVPGRYLAEAFAAGPVRRILALVHEGAVHEWEVLGAAGDPGAAARGLPYSVVTLGDARLREGAREVLERVVRGWGIGTGVLRADVFDQGDALPLRSLRSGAGGTGEVLAFAATRGVDLRRVVALAAGEGPGALSVPRAAAHAGYTVHQRQRGRLLAYDDGAVAALARHREVTARQGELLHSSAAPLSTHVFTADRPADLRALLARAEHGVRVTIEPTPEKPECGER